MWSLQWTLPKCWFPSRGFPETTACPSLTKPSVLNHSLNTWWYNGAMFPCNCPSHRLPFVRLQASWDQDLCISFVLSSAIHSYISPQPQSPDLRVCPCERSAVRSDKRGNNKQTTDSVPDPRGGLLGKPELGNIGRWPASCQKEKTRQRTSQQWSGLPGARGTAQHFLNMVPGPCVCLDPSEPTPF